MTEIEVIENAFEALIPYVQKRHGDKEGLEVSSKSHATDLLTEVDIEVQRRIAALIQEHFPDDFIVGEEEGYEQYPDDPDARTWLIDPIDGTQNFVRSIFPEFGISVAFARDGMPVVGGVAFPITDDVFLAERGAGATRNGQPLHVSDVASLRLARIEIDFGGPPIRQRTLDRANKLLVKAGQFRCHCAAVLGLCSVASGDCDGYVHVSLSPWDYAAGLLLAEEAGGRASDFHGNPLHLFRQNDGILVSNGEIHNELLAELKHP
jgi:myo-inositol-1(or 4)-monophosphatase